MPSVLHQFTGNNGDGCHPDGRLRWGEQGNLLGTTYGGGDLGDGTVYELTRSGGWQQTILHSFDDADGCELEAGLVTDRKGNWFGTASGCGKYKWGTVFEISGVP